MNRVDPTSLLVRIVNCPYGLPRGRVVRLGNGEWGVAHGNDHPAVVRFEAIIIDAFCLSDVQPKFFFDEHEQMLLSDYEQVQSSIRHFPSLPMPIAELLE